MFLTVFFRNVEAAYKTFIWESIVLIAAMLPMSLALEKTGASEYISNTLVSGLGAYGPVALMAGIYFTAYNLNYGYPLFSYTLSSITFLFLIVSPILAMRTLAEERKQKTDQLLLTAPVTVWQIVLGKYLALIVTFLLPVVILCFYPLIMAQYGSIAFASTYVALLGFFLLGCTCLAVGLFFSSLTESQILAAVGPYAFLLVCYLMNGNS